MKLTSLQPLQKVPTWRELVKKYLNHPSHFQATICVNSQLTFTQTRATTSMVYSLGQLSFSSCLPPEEGDRDGHPTTEKSGTSHIKHTWCCIVGPQFRHTK